MADSDNQWGPPPGDAVPPPPPPPSSGGPMVSPPPPPPGMGGLGLPPGPPQQESRGLLRTIATSGVARLIVIGLVLGGIGLWGAIRSVDRDDSGQIVGSGDVEATDLRVGDCLLTPGDVDEFAAVRGIPCTEAHDYEVIHNQVLPGDRAPTEDDLLSLMEQYCLPAFETYVGMPFADHPTLFLDVFWPTEEAWNNGDRVMNCLVYDDNGALTASVRAN